MIKWSDHANDARLNNKIFEDYQTTLPYLVENGQDASFITCSIRIYERQIYNIILMTQESLKHSQNQYPSFNQYEVSQMYEKIKSMADSMPQTIILRKYHYYLTEKIKFQQNAIDVPNAPKCKGRGGNSVAQNFKKALLPILKKVLGPELFKEFEQQCIDRYHLKSQKQNIVIYFLFLNKLCLQQKVHISAVIEIQTQIKKRFSRYINNSRDKMETEPERKEFHQLNIREYQKFAEINCNFRERRSFEEMLNQVKRLFLKKIVDFQKAQKKIRQIVSQDDQMRHMFYDIDSFEELSEEEKIDLLNFEKSQ